LDLLKEFRQLPQGMTDEFGQNQLGIEGNSYRPMRVTLYRHGYVEDSGDRQRLKSGRYGAVWRITESGRQKLSEEGK
jgi:predicted ArsR family transcriptional regulator